MFNSRNIRDDGIRKVLNAAERLLILQEGTIVLQLDDFTQWILLDGVWNLTAGGSGLNYQGAWDAFSNSPTLTSGVGTQGDYYVVSVAGNTDLDGINVWSVGDWAIFNGTAWQKIDNTSAYLPITGGTLTGPLGITLADTSNFISGTNSEGNTFSVGNATFSQYSTDASSNIISQSNQAGAQLSTTLLNTDNSIVIAANGLVPSISFTHDENPRLTYTASSNTWAFNSNINVSGAAYFTSMSQGSVLFTGVSGALSEDNSNFFWDDTNNRLGIGTSSPQTSLHIVGNAIRGQSNATNATAKQFDLVQGHYTNAEEALSLFTTISNATQNIVWMGGGSASYNAATDLRFFTAGTNTTTTGSERMRIDGSGLVMIGATSLSGQFNVVTGASGRVAAVIRGASGQTANLTDWQDSATNVIASIDAGGRHYGSVGSASQPSFSFVGFTNNGMFKPSGDVVAFSTASAERMRITSTGQVSIGVTSGIAQLGVVNSSAGGVAEVIRGAASQSANLTQWQDSAANILSRVDNTGAFYSDSFFRLTHVATARTAINITKTGDDGVIELYRDGVIDTLIQANAASYLAAQSAANITIGSTSSLAKLGVVNSTASTIATIIRGAASQSADLFQLQDSAGNVVSKMSVGGRFATNATYGGLDDSVNTSNYYLANNRLIYTVSSQPLIDSSSRTLRMTSDRASIYIYGSAGVGANGPLIDYDMNSNTTAGFTFFRAANGTLSGGTSGTNIAVQISPTYNPAAGSGVFRALDINYTNNASAAQTGISTGLRVNRNTSGTAFPAAGDLIADFQAAGAQRLTVYAQGTTFTEINTATNGAYGIRTDGAVKVNSFYNYATSGGWYTSAGNPIMFSNTSDLVGVGISSGIGAKFHIGGFTAGTIGQIIRGAASQTASLLEFQNSAGAVLARVDEIGDFVTSGSFYTNNGISNTSTGNNAFLGMISSGPYITRNIADSNPIFYIRNVHASSTGSLLELRDSGNNIRSKFDQIGKLHLGFYTGGTAAEFINFAGNRANFNLNASGNFEIETTNTRALEIGTSDGSTTAYFSTAAEGNAAVIGGTSTSVLGKLTVINTAAATKAFVIRGASSQTENLTEWQNSAGTNVAAFGATGVCASAFFLTGDATPSNLQPYAVLQANSTTRGFLKPRMTTAQKNAISSPGAGLEVYDTSLNGPYYYNGTSWVPTGATFTAPTIQTFTSSSGTYTKPANVLYIRVRMVGGGGGGGGSGGASGGGGTGGTGGNTTFGTTLLVANGGTGGVASNGGGTSGVGGTASLGTGPIGTALSGGDGGGGTYQAGVTNNITGGSGASSPFGGQGFGAAAGAAGGAAKANTGSGGGGAGMNAVATSTSGPGGGAGGFVDAIITSPSSTYSYAIGSGGSGGSAGTSGFAGGAGAAGYIEVTEYYQ